MAGNSRSLDREFVDRWILSKWALTNARRYPNYPEPFYDQYILPRGSSAVLPPIYRSISEVSEFEMASLPPPVPAPDRYIVIHVATTCDEHGVYVTKDSAEVIEIGWILVDAKTFDEVGIAIPDCW